MPMAMSRMASKFGLHLLLSPGMFRVHLLLSQASQEVSLDPTP